MSPATFRSESYSDCFGDIPALLLDHYEEIAHYKDIELAPNFEGYKRCEEAGNLRVYTARIDGALVGYAVFFVLPHVHYSGSVYAQGDVFFVVKEHRGKMLGLRLLRFTERELAAEGVQVVSQHSKIKHPEFGELLALEGYEGVDICWQKRLDIEVVHGPHRIRSTAEEPG